MKYLLDTHAFLWTLFEPSKLKKNIIEIISNSNYEIFLSTVSLWEISLKYGLGKLTLENVFPEDLPSLARESGFEILNITEEIITGFHRLPKRGHFDPFDRMLIWQAIQLNMTIISKDEKFKLYTSDGLQSIWS